MSQFATRSIALLALGIVGFAAYELAGLSRGCGSYAIRLDIANGKRSIAELWYSDHYLLLPGRSIADPERATVLSTHFARVSGPPFQFTYENDHSSWITTSHFQWTSTQDKEQLQLAVKYQDGTFEYPQVSCHHQTRRMSPSL